MPAKIQLTEEQLKEMFRLRVEEKLGYPSIGKLFGVSTQTAQRRIESMCFDSKMLEAKYHYDEYYFYDIDTATKAYWLLVITADGYLNEERNHFHCHLGCKDKNHLEKFLLAINGDVPIKQEVHSTTGNYIA